MTLRSIAYRVKWLETEARAHESAVIVMFRHSTETEVEAIERWRAEHPGQDPDRPGARVLMVQWAA
jgi:hypothetical protein